MIRWEKRAQKIETAEERAGQRARASRPALVEEDESSSVPERPPLRKVGRHESSSDARTTLNEEERFTMWLGSQRRQNDDLELQLPRGWSVRRLRNFNAQAPNQFGDAILLARLNTRFCARTAPRYYRDERRTCMDPQFAHPRIYEERQLLN